MKHKIDGFITWSSSAQQFSFESVDFSIFTTEFFLDYVVVGPASIEVDVPDDFSPVPGLIANLQAKKQTITAKFTAELAQVDHEIGKLLSLEHKQ